LEIGTGSGYMSAVMSYMAHDVYTIDIAPKYVRMAKDRFKQLGYTNIHPKLGDGFKGWPEHAPFDVIILTCSPPHVPRPLEEQLSENGRLLLPLGGEKKFQELVLYIKRNGKFIKARRIAPTTFTLMKGEILYDKK